MWRCYAAILSSAATCRRTEEAGDVYDAAVTEGVKRFQLRHGLDATGGVGAKP